MNLILQLKSFFPRRLPIGMASLQSWIDDILFLTGISNTPKNRQVVAGFIFQIKPNVGYISLRTVSNVLIKAASNQVVAEYVKNTEETKPKGTTEGVEPEAC